ncbi:hypothetical protein C4H54_11590, partial [Neisseria gonorrhoeae]
MVAAPALNSFNFCAVGSKLSAGTTARSASSTNCHTLYIAPLLRDAIYKGNPMRNAVGLDISKLTFDASAIVGNAE